MDEVSAATQTVSNEPEQAPVWRQVVLDYLQYDALALHSVMDYVMARLRPAQPQLKPVRR
ncbi:MAG: hypothetical protein AB7N91_27935 [Candidatus Tectimicrobiota bacterium]